MMSVLMLSTSETPDTAASPEVVTMTVSAMPTVISRSRSMTRGMMSRSSASREKSRLLRAGACSGILPASFT